MAIDTLSRSSSERKVVPGAGVKGLAGFNDLRQSAAIFRVFGFKSLDLGKPHYQHSPNPGRSQFLKWLHLLSQIKVSKV